jgi:outer membrane protein TolC
LEWNFPTLLRPIWKWFAVLHLFSLTVTPPAAAAMPAGPVSPPLSLRDCIDIALKNNHSRTVSCFSIEIAEAQHRQALSAYWPQVGIKAAYTIMDEDPNFIFPENRFNVPAMTAVAQTPFGPAQVSTPAATMTVPQQNVKIMDRENFYATLNATLPLYTGGKISSVVRQAEQGMRAAKEEARHTDLQVIYDVKRFYYGAVLAGELLRIGRETLERMEVTLELTESLYTKGSGRVKKTDYLRNKTVVEGLRSAVSALDANEKLARAALANSMGIAWDARVEVAEDRLPYAPVDAELKDLVSGVYRFNPDWASLEAGLKAAEAKVDEARSGHFPTIALFGKLTRIVNSYDAGLMTPANKNSWTIGVGLELPIFNGLRTTGEAREAAARVGRLKEQQVLLREGLALQVKNIFIRMISARRQKESSEAAAAAAEENRSLNERAYQAELVETKDVVEAQLIESLMKAQLQKALYDHLDAAADLDFVVGKEVSDLVGISNR